MAENLPTGLEEELTCHICKEMYTDPVQLSCQHSFCRECLKVYVNSNQSPSDGVQTNDGDVRCPLCRTPIDLVEYNVSKLPVHFTIANIVEKYQTGVKRRDVRPTNKNKIRKYADESKCVMCLGDQPKTAVRGCATCKCLYCQECLDAFHPMRGPFAKHALVNVKQYTSIPLCVEHDEPLSMFCTNCKQLDCYRCVVKNHIKHDIKEANDAFDEEKERIDVKASELKKSYEDINSCIEELSERKEDAKRGFKIDFQTIEGKYQNIRIALDNWRAESMKVIEERRDSVLRNTETQLEKLQSELMNIKKYLKEKSEYLESKEAVSFLQDSEDTLRSLGKQIKRTADVLETCMPSGQAKRKRLDTQVQPVQETSLYFLERKLDGSLEFRFGEHTVLCPGFSMKEGLVDSVAVRDGCRVLVNVRQETNAESLLGALADQFFQAGRVYWEIEVTYTVKVKQNVNQLVYSAGVLHQDGPRSVYLGNDGHSWGVHITQEMPYKFVCSHSQNRGSTHPVYPNGQTEYGSVRQGFYLDCISRTLTILDCTHDRVLHIFSDVDMSEPLTPAVGAYNFRCVDVFARMRTGQDISTLPPCLYKILTN